ncbi:NUDIX domain-containing protein [Candidatus Micrarchaeota archaeon]|nr:NUDIX domain-containing protein [Candidatus Micrarchaeota archaeon]
MESFPKVGVGVIVAKGGMVLAGMRKNSHGQGTWAFPGGRLEEGETVFECAKREAMEEAGVKINNLRNAAFTEDVFEDGKKYVTLFVLSDLESGEPKNLEPEKCGGWQWFNWSEIPQPRFLPLRHLFEQEFNPFK